MYKVVETVDELEKALRVRHEVFTIGRGINAKLDDDGKDDEATHLIAVKNNEIVGTIRILINGENSLFQRLAVLPNHRGNDSVTGLINYAINLVKEQGIKEINVHSQEYTLDLYEKLGFEMISEPYLEAGVPQVSIRKRL